jgi:hypothetical protein
VPTKVWARRFVRDSAAKKRGTYREVRTFISRLVTADRKTLFSEFEQMQANHLVVKIAEASVRNIWDPRY